MGKDSMVEIYKAYAAIQRARRALTTSEYRLKRKLSTASTRGYREELIAMLETYYMVDYILEKIEVRLETILVTGTYNVEEWISDVFGVFKLLQAFQQSIPTEVLDIMGEAMSSVGALIKSDTMPAVFSDGQVSRGYQVTENGAATKVLEEAREYARVKIKALETNIG